MSNLRNGLIAIVVAVLLGVLLRWFDGTVLVQAQHDASQNFRLDGAGPLLSIGFLLVGGSVLLAAALGWVSRSPVAGIAYLVIGLGVALVPWLGIGLTTCIADGTSCTSTFPLFADWYFTLAAGVINAVLIYAAGVGIAGVAILARSLRGGRP